MGGVRQVALIREKKGCWRTTYIVGSKNEMVFGVDLGGGGVKNQAEFGSLPWL